MSFYKNEQHTSVKIEFQGINMDFYFSLVCNPSALFPNSISSCRSIQIIFFLVTEGSMNLTNKPMLTYLSLGIYCTLHISLLETCWQILKQPLCLWQDPCGIFFTPWSVSSVIRPGSTVIQEKERKLKNVSTSRCQDLYITMLVTIFCHFLWKIL